MFDYVYHIFNLSRILNDLNSCFVVVSKEKQNPNQIKLE